MPQKCRRLFKYGHAAWDPPRGLAGGLADHVLLVPGTAIVPLPDCLTNAAAAPASCAVATAVAILRAAGEAADRSVVVFGAGMLGLSVASLAKAAGAGSVTIVDPRAERLERATGVVLGIITSKTPPSGDQGADIVVEAGGALDAVAAAIELVAVGGTCVLAGTVSPVGQTPLDPERLVRTQGVIRGVHNYGPEDLVAAVQHLASPAGAGLAAAVGPVFPLARVNEALAAAAVGDALRVVVTP
jgi:threonine dehydrogenase-like Zn-dependent dehydrogenase